ncbi:dihydrodipicolinate synthase [endosymbiont of Acanthamoeba sp. UWC8]|uniref:4-hydroxy-tetrahydrodipicolinate synthase n=1 Tax=endosymbiont of Acanthamoeba sp. UWC8 TaxID=86106 RepID=UPI0004D0E6B5|nr:4-hydroxy-tetrahydrodipicolinate synthase [endosymbiont of Acanthamoeba sp. UWC8]AIF81370.1 dihydrodipicolinate synthase [endosymbiont of Acanthamoeba sp. UWC8]
MFKGLLTALITPFIKGEVDYESFTRFVRWQIKSKVHGLVVLGSTGEGATIGDEERTALIKLCRKEIDNSGTKIPLIAATGSNSTIKTLQYTEEAKELGADAALIVCPYYNKPSQQGMYEHYKYINDNTDLPIFIYNVPGRTIVNINNETVSELAELRNIIGIKDATGDLARPLNLKATLSNTDFIQLSGEDATSAVFNLNGGVGCISIIGNLFPEAMSRIQDLTLNEQYPQAVSELKKYLRIIDLMYCETNPIPVKYAAFRMGLISTPELRLPLLTLTHPNCIKIDNELKTLGVI